MASGEGDGTVRIWRYSHKVKPPGSRLHEVADVSYDGFLDKVFLNCLDEVELMGSGSEE